MPEESTPSKKVQAAKATGRVALGTAKVIGRGTLAVGKPIAKASGRAAKKSGEAAFDYSVEQGHRLVLRKSQFSQENFFEKASLLLQDTVDALLNQKQGTSSRVVRGLAAALGSAGATAGVFGIASLLGTANTGTAIASLSGAAFNSAALAWIGGNMATGAWIVAGLALAGAISGRFAMRRFLGKKRKQKKLDEQEQRVIDTCLLTATAFHKQAEGDMSLNPLAAQVLRDQLCATLLHEVDVCISKVSDWPTVPLGRLKRKRRGLVELVEFLETLEPVRPPASKTGQRIQAVSTGAVSAVFLKLLAEDLPDFSEDEKLVLDALRRSNGALADATEEELADYVQSLSPEQLTGLKNNVKGIYHELAFAARENGDGDEYIVELFEDSNHPGADVRIINTETGELTEIQLKATKYEAYVREHNQRYEDVAIFATEEVAASAGVESSEITNKELTRDTEQVIGALGHEARVLESMGVAAMVNLSFNAAMLLRGGTLTREQKGALIEGGVVSASVAGLVQLIL